MKRKIEYFTFAFTFLVLFAGCKTENRPELDPALKQKFFQAVDNNNLSEIKSLLAKEANLVYAKDDLGFTPLMKAARYGEPNIVEFLLRSKSEVNAQADMGETALFRTIDVGKIKNAELLLKHGADPNIKEDSQDWAPLSCAAYYGNLELVKLLLANGAEINVTGEYDQTPMHWSIRAITWQNQKEIVEVLLKNGVNVNQEDSDGKTALQMAERRSSEGVVELLRNHGAR